MVRRALRALLMLAAMAGAVAGVVYARRDLNEPADATGAGLPLKDLEQVVGRSADAHVVARRGEPEWVRDLAAWTPPPAPVGIRRALAYVWASPSTLAGLLAGLLSGAVPHLREGVLVFSPVRGPMAWLMRRGGFAATTLGHVILSRREPSAQLMAHELAHTRQAELFGPLMGPLYWYLLVRYGYVRHPMERAARLAGRQAVHAAAGHTRPGTPPIRR